MEYSEWLEHAETLARACVRETKLSHGDIPALWAVFETIQSEIQNERRRGELAVQLSESKEAK